VTVPRVAAHVRYRLATFPLVGYPLLLCWLNHWLPVPRADVQVRLSDGRLLQLRLSDRTQRTMWLGLFEPSESRLVSELLQPGDVFVDVGAHVGWFTTIAARQVTSGGQVIACEPYPENATSLRKNLALNKMQNVLVVESALGSRAGTIRLRKGSDSGSVTALDWSTGDAEDVPMTTLDEITSAIAAIKLLKIDVEGWEPQVLRGAVETLKRSANVLIEINRPALQEAASSPEELLDLLRGNGLTSFVTVGQTGFRRLHRDNRVVNVLASRVSPPSRSAAAGTRTDVRGVCAYSRQPASKLEVLTVSSRRLFDLGLRQVGVCLRHLKGLLDRPQVNGRRPRVALVIDAVFPYHLGGREIRYHELTRRLASSASIDVYTMHWWQGRRRLEDGDITFHAISRVHAMYAGGQRSIRQALFFAAGCVRLLWHDFDVLDADHMPYLQIVVLRAVATLKRKPLVVTWHEVWGRDYWRKYLGPAGIPAWFIEWLAMRMPDRIIAASPQTEQRLRAILGPQASITVAPNGVDLVGIRSALPDSSPTDLIVVGRLIAHKRVDMLLDAVASLRAAGIPVTCRVVGDGPEREALHDHARALHIGDAIDFRHDIREQKDLFSLIKAARVAVFPSEREGFGAAVLEALACGIPVVTTSSPDNLSQHLVARSERGYVCDASAAALAEVIERILSQDTQSPEVEVWLAEYSWDAVATRVASVLQI